MERYRSGHNGAVLKTVRVQAHMGSNPILSANFKNCGVKPLNIEHQIQLEKYPSTAEGAPLLRE